MFILDLELEDSRGSIVTPRFESIRIFCVIECDLVESVGVHEEGKFIKKASNEYEEQ